MFFNYLSYYLYGYGKWSKNGPWGVWQMVEEWPLGVWQMVVENYPDSHKPVEIGDLGAQVNSKVWGSLEGPKRPTEAVKGYPECEKVEISFLAGLD